MKLVCESCRRSVGWDRRQVGREAMRRRWGRLYCVTCDDRFVARTVGQHGDKLAPIDEVEITEDDRCDSR